MSVIPPPVGNPTALDHSVDQYAATAQALEAAADEMERALREGEGAAMAELRSRSARASHGLRGAESRYDAATSALRDYAVELHAFHHATGRAQADYSAAQSHQSHAHWRVQEAHARVREASMSPDQPHLLEEAQAELYMANAAVDAAADAMYAAQRAYAHAEEALNEAAEIARARIEGGFDATKDGLLDYAREVWDAAVGVLEAVAQWAKEFFAQVVDAIVEAVELFLLGVAFVLLAVALVALLIVALQVLTVVVAVIAAVLVVALAVVLQVLQYVVFLVRTGKFAYDIATLLGLDGTERLRMVVAAVGVACPPLGLFILTRLRSEMGKPTPEVDLLDTSTIHGDDAKTAYKQINTEPITDVADVLQLGGRVDAIGGSEQGVVDITEVKDAQGNVVSYIIALPSTMDWDVPFDQGAPNDLDADLMLMLYPELRTQYENAVLAAMAEAGVSTELPILLTGWSLGGIMGGSLIESGAGGYNYGGLICAGSPIDGIAIPPEIPVLQVKHTLDPVHRADLMEHYEVTATHLEVWDGPNSGEANIPIKTGNLVGHANGDYVSTLEAQLAYDPSINDLFSDFLVPQPGSSSDPVPHLGDSPASAEHSQYAFSE